MDGAFFRLAQIDSHSPLSSRARRGRVLLRLAISARLCPGRRAERIPGQILTGKKPPASPPRRLFPGFAHVCPSDSGSGRGGSVGSSVGFIYN